jgi:hypothetical protein
MRHASRYAGQSCATQPTIKGMDTRSLVLAAVFLALASSLGAQSPARYSARDIHLRIETDRPTYRVGDSIRVRLTLRNLSDHPVRFENQSATLQARLRVYDAVGQQVEPTVRGVVGRGGGPKLRLKAGGEATLLYWKSPPRQEWLNLQDWGYNLRVPGRYTIVGIPGVFGQELTPDYETVRSNRATLTIVP